MKTITIPGFIYAKQPEDWQYTLKNVVGGVAYDFWTQKDMTADGYTKVCPFEMTFDLPESFNPVEGFVKNLEAEKQKVRADFQARITEIDRQINQLLAIEMTEVQA